MQIRSMLNWAMRRNQVKYFIRRAANEGSGVSDEIRLSRFNAVWKDAYENVPFYAEWKVKHSLPDAIAALKELSSWPVLEKKDIILNADKFVRPGYVGSFQSSVTGGSTGEPLHFRIMPGESLPGNVNMWIGRARMGIYPDTRTFLFWGHRHLHGQGVRSDFHFAVRRFKDWLTNYYRADATDLSPQALNRVMRSLLKFRPKCIISYSASLLALVKNCSDCREACRHLGVEAILCTAGPLTKSERDAISDFFDSPIGMEYGSMECSVMAYQTPMAGGRYEVFDSTHILHAGVDAFGLKKPILVTTLYQRYFPLFRYRIGDYMEGEQVKEDGTIASFAEVSGRTGDLIDLDGEVRFHGYSMMVCAESNKKIIAYQLRVNKERRKVVFVAQTIHPLTDDEKREVVSLASDVSNVPEEMISVVESDQLVKAPSGKIKLVVFED